MSPIHLKKQGMATGHADFPVILRKLAQQHAHTVAAAITALTNNSGGSVGTVSDVDAFSNAAASGSNLSDTTTTDAALDTVHDALRELYTKANAVAAALGVDQVTYSGGGASTDGTVAAITVSVTGAATGSQATNLNTVRTGFNNAFYQLAVLTNKLAVACGLSEMDLDYSLATDDTIDAITIATGSAADPGVTKAAVDAALVVWRTNVKTIAEKLIAINTTADPLVIAQ